MDQDIDLELEDESLDGSDEPKTEQTPEEVIAELREENKRYSALSPLLKELEENPDRIYDMRAALRGERISTQPTQPTGQTTEQLSPEKLKEMNQQVTDMMLEGRGLDAVALVADNIAQNRVAQTRKEYETIIGDQGDEFVEKFRSTKEKGTTPTLYSAIEASFNDELTDLDRKELMRKPLAERKKDLERRWNAAAGEVLLKKVKPTQVRTGGVVGSGVGMGRGSAQSGGLSEHERSVMRRGGLSDKQIAEFEREERAGR